MAGGPIKIHTHLMRWSNCLEAKSAQKRILDRRMFHTQSEEILCWHLKKNVQPFKLRVICGFLV